MKLREVWTIPHCPRPQSLRVSHICSLQGQGTARPLVRGQGHLNDLILGTCQTQLVTSSSLSVVSIAALFINLLHHSPRMYRYPLELARRPFNILFFPALVAVTSSFCTSLFLSQSCALFCSFWLSLKNSIPTHNTLPAFLYLYTVILDYTASINPRHRHSSDVTTKSREKTSSRFGQRKRTG